MRKITSLLMLLLLCVGTAWGQITVGSVYSIQNKNSQHAISQDANMELALVTANTGEHAQLWIAEEGSATGTYKLRNLASGAYAQYVDAIYTHWYTDFIATDFYIGQLSDGDGETPAYYYISLAEIPDATVATYKVMHESNGYVVRWEQTNVNSQWAFVEVEDIDVSAISENWKSMTTVKTKAMSNVEPLSQLSIFSTAADAIKDIEAITATSTEVAQLKTAADAINEIASNVMMSVNGKSIILNNKRSDDRAGLSPTAFASTNKVYGTASERDDIIWTIKSQADGSFKLYNFVANKYMPDPGVEDLTDEAGATSYNFLITGENTAALVGNGKMLHQANYWSPNYSLISWWDIEDAASLWEITEVDINIEHDLYDNAVAAATTLPYAMQQAYGLVTSGDNIKVIVNHPSGSDCLPSSNLLDGNTSTYVHSSYDTNTMDTVDKHYIQADMGENGIDQFYVYMTPRNANNRPKEIVVSGSNSEDGEYTTIATITTTLATSDAYMSELLGTEGTNYRYIRLTVNSTNTSSKFFTLSECYFLPASDDAAKLADAYIKFPSTSITSNEITAIAEVLVNGEATLAFSNIKKEIGALLTANANNHAEKPALGQYTTAGYDALNAAYTATDATQESLEAAIVAFNKSKNLPVFTISGTVDYVLGKSIYDNNSGTLYFQPTNNYDRSMLWVFDQATETVGVTDEVVVTNYATNSTFWGAPSVKITETSDANTEDGIFLLYTTGNATTVHFQNAGQQMVRYNSTASNTGSAMTFTYIGTTYELDQLTDEQFSALSALQTAVTANAKYIDVEFGDGPGKYTGSQDAFNTAITQAQTIIQDTPILDIAAMNVADITAVTTAITESAATFKLNMPTAGFYRVKSMNGNDDEKKGKYWQTKADASGMELAAEMDNARSIIYLGEDNTITSYYGGYALNQYTGMDAAGSEGKAWTIVENAMIPGAYALFSNGNSYCLSDWTGGATYGQNDANAAWAIEAVEELPVTISAAGYATLYAPVALTIPTEVNVYTGAVNEDVLTLNAVETTIPANTGVVLEAEEGEYNFAIGADVAAIEGNALSGTVATTAKPTEGEVFTLQSLDEGIGFYPFTGENVSGFKAYLNLPAGSGIKGLRFEEVTGIENAIAGENGNAAIFDLSGRRVSKMQKGVYIVNGKKVLVK